MKRQTFCYVWWLCIPLVNNHSLWWRRCEATITLDRRLGCRIRTHGNDNCQVDSGGDFMWFPVFSLEKIYDMYSLHWQPKQTNMVTPGISNQQELVPTGLVGCWGAVKFPSGPSQPSLANGVAKEKVISKMIFASWGALKRHLTSIPTWSKSLGTAWRLESLIWTETRPSLTTPRSSYFPISLTAAHASQSLSVCKQPGWKNLDFQTFFFNKITQN